MRALSDSKYWYGFINDEPVNAQTSRLYFSNTELRGFATWIISSGSYAKVEKPEELKSILDQYVSGIVSNYK
jgi:hypothetical protein